MKIFQVDAFTQEKFKGNPAAVCLIPEGETPSDKWMQSVAAEMNLSETAFLAKKAGGVFSLRWFTPEVEVDLCGHATMAAAHILWQEDHLPKNDTAEFDTRSGRLNVSLNDEQIVLDLPVEDISACQEPVGLEMALGCAIISCHETSGKDLLVEVYDEETVVNLKPSMQQLSVFPFRCVIVTAKGKNSDFVSRVFGPQVGIDEDPVTGSTHCSLTPFWAKRLSKKSMKAQQLSQRGGKLSVSLLDGRVSVAGHAVTVLRGELC